MIDSGFFSKQMSIYCTMAAMEIMSDEAGAWASAPRPRRERARRLREESGAASQPQQDEAAGETWTKIAEITGIIFLVVSAILLLYCARLAMREFLRGI